MLSSHSIVSSSRTVKPCSTWEGQWTGRWRTTWLTVCSFSYSQASEVAIPQFLVQTGVETSDTSVEVVKLNPYYHRRAILGRWVPMSGMKVWSLSVVQPPCISWMICPEHCTSDDVVI